jgi:Tfp pilus assembly protein PilF
MMAGARRGRLGVIVALMLGSGVATAQTPTPTPAKPSAWSRLLDAGWKALRDGKYAEAERKLRDAIEAAKPYGERDMRLATSFEAMAWLLYKEGK